MSAPQHATPSVMLSNSSAPITRFMKCGAELNRARRAMAVGSLFLLLLTVRNWDLLFPSRPSPSAASSSREKGQKLTIPQQHQPGADTASDDATRGDDDSTGGARVSVQELKTGIGQARTKSPAPAPAPAPARPVAELREKIRASPETSKDTYDVSKKTTQEGEEGLVNLEPLLTCRRRSGTTGEKGDDSSSSPMRRKKKLAFVHIFKTAGSTMRGLFDRYSARCRLGWALVVSCTSADADSVLHTNTTWKKRDKKGKCHLKRWTRDDGRRFDGLEGESARFDGQFLRENVDIVGGHLPLGVADHTWPSSDSSDGAELRYLAFFRDALHKYVSARMFVKTKKGKGRGKALSYFVDLIRDEVTRHLARGDYYEGYYKYLMTPEQVATIERTRRFRNMTAEQRVAERARIVKRNMIEYDVICGITERMPQSLEVLNHVIDSDGGARDIFELWGMPYRNGSLPPMHISNPSRGFKTSTVVKELERDPAFFAKLKEYVKYEQQVTDFAIVMHEKQYESMKRQRKALQY